MSNGNGKAGIIGGIAVVVVTVLGSFGITRASWASLNKDVTVACTTLDATQDTAKANAAAIAALQIQQAAYNATVVSIDKRLDRIEDYVIPSEREQK